MRKLLLVTTLVTAFLIQALANAAPVTVTRAEDVGMSSERLDDLKSHFKELVDNEESGGFQILVSRRGKLSCMKISAMQASRKKFP